MRTLATLLLTLTTSTACAHDSFAVRTAVEGVAGSGVHIGNGYVLTADHAVSANTDGIVIIKVDNYETFARVMWGNAHYDIALLRLLELDTPLDAVDLTCSIPSPGDIVTVYGDGKELHGKVTSAIQRVNNEVTYWPIAQLVAHPITGGMSGGAVVNSSSDLVGIVVGEGVIVPSSVACELMGKL